MISDVLHSFRAAMLGISVVILSNSVTALAIQVTAENNADLLASTLFPGIDGLVYTFGSATLDFGDLDEDVETFPTDSIGTFINPELTYGIGNAVNPGAQGIVLSSGSIFDYQTGPNVSGSTSSFFGTTASATLNGLMSPISGQPRHHDVTALVIPFENSNASPTLLQLYAVFGTEETPDFVNSSYNDSFAIYLNGTNIATSGGLPLNVDHPGHLPFFATELDTVVTAPSEFSPFDPRLPISGVAFPGLNELIIILGDATDSVYDSTAYISRDIVPAAPPGVPLLPSNTPGLGDPFIFPGINLPAGEPIAIDPVVAIGYVYDAFVDSGPDPLFASVLVNPAGNDTDFLVHFEGNTFPLQAGMTFDFTSVIAEGVATFTIDGIDPNEMLPPDDPLAFLTVVTFTSDLVNATITQLPITIPEPNSFGLFMLGLAGVAPLRRIPLYIR